jgi:hypothetical protein
MYGVDYSKSRLREPGITCRDDEQPSAVDSSEATVAVKRASGTSRSGPNGSLEDSQREISMLCFALL